MRGRQSSDKGVNRCMFPRMSAPVPEVQEEHVLPGVSPKPADERHFPLKRIVRFGSFVSTVLLLVNALVCATWSAFFHVPGWIVWQMFPAGLALAFIPTTILRFRSNHPALRIVYALCASWLGALNFAFFAALACQTGEVAAWLFGWPLPRFALAAILFGLAAVATLYGLINANWLQVSRVTVRLPNLPAAWQGRTVALLTDLHLGPLSGAAFLGRVIARLRSLEPEAVFISGDLFDGPTIALNRLVAPWAQYSPPRGAFYVTGNHDEFSERSLYLAPVRRVGIRVLNNEKTSVEGLQIVGVHDSEAGDPAQLREILRQARIDRARPSILLSHRPVNLSVPEEEGHFPPTFGPYPRRPVLAMEPARLAHLRPYRFRAQPVGQDAGVYEQRHRHLGPSTASRHQVRDRPDPV